MNPKLQYCFHTSLPLQCYAVFQRKVLLPSSGSKSKQYVCLLLVLLSALNAEAIYLHSFAILVHYNHTKRCHNPNNCKSHARFYDDVARETHGSGL
jgi:hypothetical protein